MPDFLQNKKVVIPIILIAAMLLFIVISLGCRGAGGDSIVDTEEPEEMQIAPTIGVHITGAVYYPGFFEVERGSRINDIVQLAGGATYNANLGGINLAEVAFDQQQIHIPMDGEMTPDGTGRRINLNTANSRELQELPGVGEATAERIIELRQRMGGFNRVEDIMNVQGISAGRFEQMRDMIVVP